jgi:hypothetical protein
MKSVAREAGAVLQLLSAGFRGVEVHGGVDDPAGEYAGGRDRHMADTCGRLASLVVLLAGSCPGAAASPVASIRCETKAGSRLRSERAIAR